jgi:hypothetical protein
MLKLPLARNRSQRRGVEIEMNTSRAQSFYNRSSYLERNRDVIKRVHNFPRLLFGSLTLTAFALVHAASTEIPDFRVAPLLDLAHDVSIGSAQEKSDFAQIALQEMAFAFESEANRLRDYYADNPHVDREETSWIRSTMNYATFLRALASSAQSFSLVDIYPQSHGEIMLRIDGTPVIIGGPRPKDNAALEQAIVDGYCQLWPCEHSESKVAQSRAIIDRASHIEGNWSFSASQGPVFETDDGLLFVFSDSNGLSWKKRQCLQVVEELRLLAYSIRYLAERGFPIDWQAVSITSTGVGYPNKVTVNRRGDHAMIRIPSLYQSPGLLQIGLPWVRARVEGRKHQQRFIQAERLLAQVTPYQ